MIYGKHGPYVPPDADLTPPADYVVDDAPECDHDDYDLDILTGRATCGMCGERWYASAAEQRRHERLNAQPYPDYVVEYKRRGPFFTTPMKFALFFSLLALLIGVVGWAVVG